MYDKQYTAVGYFDFMTISRIQVYFFNDVLRVDFKLGNLYDLVESGEWTWDKMVEMCETVAEDVNQDGVMDEQDRFGLSSRWDYWIGEPATAGYQYITRNENGEYAYTGLTDALIELHDKIYPMTKNSSLYMSAHDYGQTANYSVGKNLFVNNQCLFVLEQLTWVSSDQLRDYGEYGILPSPKYLDDQEDYGTASSAYVSAICSTTGNLRISSIILEALQIESYNTVRPAYLNEALSYKYLNDPQAVEMLSLIFREVTTDWNYNYCNAGVANTLYFALPTQEYLGSFFQKNLESCDKVLQSFVKLINEMP